MQAPTLRPPWIPAPCVCPAQQARGHTQALDRVGGSVSPGTDASWVPGVPASGAVPFPQTPPVLSGVFTDVEASLKDIRELLEEDELLEQKLQEALGQAGASLAGSKAELAEVRRDWAKYMEVHEKASFTNSELHRAMNLHVGNLRLLSGPLDQVRAALPTPALTPGEPHTLPRPPAPSMPVGGGAGPEPLVSPTTAAPRGQGCAAELEAHPGQGAGDAGPARVPGAAAAGAHPEG